MKWLVVGMACVFAYISLSMYIAAFKEKNEQERAKLMKSGFGTLVLTLMGIYFAWNSFFSVPPTP